MRKNGGTKLAAAGNNYKPFPTWTTAFILTMKPLFLENFKLPMDKQLSLEQNKAFYFPYKKELRKLHESWDRGFFIEAVENKLQE